MEGRARRGQSVHDEGRERDKVTRDMSSVRDNECIMGMGVFGWQPEGALLVHDPSNQNPHSPAR